MRIEHIREVLGTPYYEADGCALYNMDCLTAMRDLPVEVVDLTVTSPPYNIGKEYDKDWPLPDYLDWCIQWIRELYRITRSEGAFWLNLGYLSMPGRAKAIPIPYLLWNRIPFFLIQEIVWHYGAGVAGRKFFSPRNEKFLWYVKDQDSYTFNLDDVRDPNVKYPNQKKNGKIKVNRIGKNPADVWQFPKVTSGTKRAAKERTPHPAQFPISVIERIVKSSSHPGDVVLDPFMGSGTTAVVALSLGRQVVGFEIRRDYCELAAQRLSDYLTIRKEREAQAQLFPNMNT
ncbi:MAG: site-specific DNA-methyltransferase [Pyrinomonadaceae bacterium]|nr:site-specific DNA-methyltransferase [Pyrinomonadaceae bacterium]